MATVTGFTAERMLVIENTTVVDGEVQGDNLILMTREGTPIDAGNVRGPKGDPGTPGAPGAPSGLTSVNEQIGSVYTPRTFANKAALDAWTTAPKGTTAVILDRDSVSYKGSGGWNSSDGVRTFATVAERDSRWPSPPQGAVCITLDTYAAWKYTSSGWINLAPTPPAVQGQPGTAVRFGSVQIPNINQTGNFVFDVMIVENGLIMPYRTLTTVQFDFFAGYGAAEGMGQADIVPLGIGAAVASTPSNIRIPAAAYMPFPIGAAWYNEAGNWSSFKLRFYNHSLTNFHTAGQVTWTMFAA